MKPQVNNVMTQVKVQIVQLNVKSLAVVMGL
jgi:hypothetical protein